MRSWRPRVESTSSRCFSFFPFSFPPPRDVAKSLKPAVENAFKIKKNLQRTNEMTLADVISVSQMKERP